ncbi:MAG: efflux RND transporter periplasmic adaptor subunit [Alcanivoracaceae bacterium]|nr:efflux RND transporter periplasmic adaptor subunit [Alcanivoracaceae bacterium]
MFNFKKNSLILVAIIVGFISGYYFKSNDVPQSTHPDLLLKQGESFGYVCPMHAHITSDKEGTCSICGMDLVVNSRSEVRDEDHPKVQLSSSISNSIGVKTGKVIRGELLRNVDTLGKITRLDSTARNIVTTPIHGKISYITDKFQGDDVYQGDLLFSVISDELDLLAEEYQLAFKSMNQPLVSDLFTKLRAIGLTPEQIVELENGEITNVAINIYSAEDGFIFIRRGDVGTVVKPGYTVFNIGGDYQLAEVTAEIFERQWGRVEEGQPAMMTLRNLPGMEFPGIVSRVEPPVGYTTRSLEIKLKFKINDARISQSMFAQVSISGTPRKNLLLVPSMAVIRTQNQQRVVKTNGHGDFQPVIIVAGEESMGMTEVISGLKEGDTIITSGQFLIDSESQLLAGFKRMSTTQ